MRYPWTSHQWQQLQQRRQAQRLPHAILLAGPQGLGKGEFALDLAQGLLCEQPGQDGSPCGQCRACARFLASSHPDLLKLEPEEPGKAIKVDQVRELIRQLTLTSHQGGFRVAIVQPAERMNLAAANSLLKTLEEPPADTLIILLSASPSLLPATILSRCQRLDFVPPPAAEAMAWLSAQPGIEAQQVQALLALADGAPVAARELAQADVLAQRQGLFESFLAIAGGKTALSQLDIWLKPAMPTPINWLCSWINDLIRLKANPESALHNRDLQSGLQNLRQQVDLQGLFRFLDALYAILRMQRSPLNAQMLMEGVLLQWQALSHGQANDN
jgi:DNA polymerase III subunit delta'